MYATQGFLSTQPGATILALKVQPRARKNAIVGPLGDELRISLTAPPVEDAANEALIRFLAEQFDCTRNQIEIVRGRASRHKIVRINGLPSEAILQRLFSAP